MTCKFTLYFVFFCVTILTLCGILLRDCIKCKNRVYVHCAIEAFVLHANIATVASFEYTELNISSLERKMKKIVKENMRKRFPDCMKTILL